ncbi:hypothetical protein NDU88_003256 [Pleurodeles waltl]|uniref:Uncharacterized protein n=1 Tax=Pleurodeles waltl TaxID=8319 RepID=A0AAV7UC04_PLEWA|nr:hypothetical protein NDU88_003256 [Pleurodeles waltl]
MFRDGGVRGFLRDAGLTVLGDWVVDGRLLDIPEALSDCDGTPLQRFCALRVRALLRDRFLGVPGAPLEFRALEVPHRRLVGLLMLLAKRRVAMCWGRGELLVGPTGYEMLLFAMISC